MIDIIAKMAAADGVNKDIVALVAKLHSEQLDKNQKDIYRFVTERLSIGDRQIVVKASRQIGKSYFLSYLAIACALLIPGAQIKYAAPTGKMARNIIRPHFRTLTAGLPEDLWDFNSQQGEYTFNHPTGEVSTVTIGGCDAGNIESLRGQHAHIVIVDEAGFIADLRYAIDDVLMPQTINTRGVIVMASTPAKTPGHPFRKFCADAAAEGRLISRTVYDNPRLDTADIAPLIKAARGEKSATWRREYMVEDVVDDQTAVLPNATTDRVLSMMYVDHGADQGSILRPLPSFPAPSTLGHIDETYTSISVGFGLNTTGVLFGYYDPNIRVASTREHPDEKYGAIVVAAEREIRGMDTGLLADAVLAGEDKLWRGTRWAKSPFRRIANFAPTMMGDVQSEHGLKCTPPIPVDLVESVNATRLRVEGVALRINRDCESLLRQMQTAIWKPNMKQFEDSEDDDNQALLHSLAQLVRNVKGGGRHSESASNMRRLLSGSRRA